MPGQIIVLEKDVSQQQGRVTDNLATIIQRAQFEHRTGELHVKRVDGLTVEQGSITFIDGRAVQAQIGSIQAAAAFEKLRTWKQCIFIFVAHSSGSYRLPAPSQTPQPPSNFTPNSGPLNSGSLSGILPSQTQPLDKFSSSNIHTPLPQNSPVSNAGWTQPLEGISPTARNTTTPLEGDKQRAIQEPVPAIPLIAVPRATMSVVKAIGLINKASLPRTCRQVILLIDGRLSVNEIIGMSNISPADTMRALHALENLAVITIMKPG